MRCQRHVRPDQRTRTTQFDLFAALGGETVPTPAWGALPEDTRRTLKRRDWLALPEQGMGIVVHDVHRERDY